MADSMEMPFGMGVQVGPRNAVLVGGPDPPPQEGPIFWRG